MKIRTYSILLLVLLTVLTSCAPIAATQPATSSALTTIRFAVTDLQGLEELQRDFGAFRDKLSEILGMEVEFFPVTNRAAAAVALQSKQVDLVLTGPAEYVVIRSRTNAVPVIGLIRPNYKSVIAVHADSGIKTLADLKGKKIAMTDVGSTSGHLGPSQILVDGGLDPLNDVEVLTLGDAAVPSFINRDVDALGIAFLTYERVLARENLTKEQVPLLVEGPTLPHDLFVASADLPAETIAMIRTRLLENEQALLETILVGEGNSKYAEGGLIEVADADYDYVRSMYKAVGVDDFNEFIGD